MNTMKTRDREWMAKLDVVQGCDHVAEISHPLFPGTHLVSSAFPATSGLHQIALRTRDYPVSGIRVLQAVAFFRGTLAFTQTPLSRTSLAYSIFIVCNA